MGNPWIDICEDLILDPDCYKRVQGRKIFRNRLIEYPYPIDSNLTLQDAGYKPQKMSALRRLYLHEESIETAIRMWEKRKKQGKYGSVCFHCYNHLSKPWSEGSPNKINSSHGPCLQSVVITLLERDHIEITLTYRTTEIIKKFLADLILLRDHMLNQFDFGDLPVRLNLFFINISVGDMYIPFVLCHQKKPIKFLRKLKKSDPLTHKHFMRVNQRIFDFEPGDHWEVTNFNQTNRVIKEVREMMSYEMCQKINRYIEENRE